MLISLIKFFLDNRLIAGLLILVIIGWGLMVAPFNWANQSFLRDPVPVDAIPDIGDNQQIVYTTWEGRSPQDIEDQITYPLTAALLGIPGVKQVRSHSIFGVSSIYLIFQEDIEFYWSRSRILEKLNALPRDLLPDGVQPSLGPDATALGQIFWYTLEGRDQQGKPAGGWNLQELRSLQDFYVRYGLSASEGVAEVASIGGFVQQYQVEVDPLRMNAYNVGLDEVIAAIRESNLDVGAQSMEINLVEYFIRGIGYVKQIEDIEESVVRSQGQVPIRIKDIARVQRGPANRRGILDKSGQEAVGGVVVARYGSNPMEVIQGLKQKIKEIEPGLPTKLLADGRVSQVKIIPFYDRTQLIQETLATLSRALMLEILITILVILLMLRSLKVSILVSSLLPLAVLLCFIAMKYTGVEANLVALAGIAIAIGTMVDMGLVLGESISLQIEKAPEPQSLYESVLKASVEVAPAIVTALLTTLISFIPVFTLQAAEGKLFLPLAYTKTFALMAAMLLSICVMPAMAYTLFGIPKLPKWLSSLGSVGAVGLGIFCWTQAWLIPAQVLIAVGTVEIGAAVLKAGKGFSEFGIRLGTSLAYAGLLLLLLTRVWMPLGVDHPFLPNVVFVIVGLVLLLGSFFFIEKYYESLLRGILAYRPIFFLAILLLLSGGTWVMVRMEKSFLPALDEGSFLLMPSTLPHAGMQANLHYLQLLDLATTAIPEVELVVGKAGRVESALDPAPMSMYENVILYKPEYKLDEKGNRGRYRTDPQRGAFLYDEDGALIPDAQGQYFRQWRSHIHSPADIWQEITKATRLPGLIPAPKLQPIETRLLMLQTGMRAPMGIKVKGTDLTSIERFGLDLELILKDIEGVEAQAVFADRIIGKPYLHLELDRKALARHGLSIAKAQRYLQTAIGGQVLTTTVEGRERYGISLRYPRDWRQDPESLKEIFLPSSTGIAVPLAELLEMKYEQGPQAIKSEDGFLVSYIFFDKQKGFSEARIVERVQSRIESELEKGTLSLPKGVNYVMAGNYEQQLRANKRLALFIPITLVLIFLVLYLQFRSLALGAIIFVGIGLAFAGGFLLLGIYQLPFLQAFHFLGVSWAQVFQINAYPLSVAVWIGFLALFGIATDDGVLIGSFIRQRFDRHPPSDKASLHQLVLEAGKRRVRPALMTTATTILALLPILTATGRGADLMLPMALPTLGGMLLQTLTMFTVPVLFVTWQEFQLPR